MKKPIIALTAALLAGAGLAACGNQAQAAPKLVASYIASSLADGSYGDGSWVAKAYEVNLYEGDLYQSVETELQYGFGMMLASTSYIRYGTYVSAVAEDGVQAITLNAASEMLLNSYSKAGGFSIVLNTMNQTYPVEMPAKIQGEKNMANSKQDIIDYAGAGYVLYADVGKNTFSLVNPDDKKASDPVKTASGDVSKLAAKKVKDFQIVNEFVTPESYGEGSWSGHVHSLLSYEDGKFEYSKTSITFGFGMLLSTSAIHNVGNITYGASEDGSTKVTLSDADEVLFNAFSKAGGFNIQIDTRTAAYPVEMLAKTQGEKNMANSKQDVVNEYGKGRDYWLSSTSATLSLSDPNA